MIKSVTGEQLTSVTDSELEAAGSKDIVPGQIPFYKFDEEELESFDPKCGVSTAEDYLKSVIWEARQQPEIVRASIPIGKIQSASDNVELTFKQLSTSSLISKSNFEDHFKIDSKYLPSDQWKVDRLEIFKHARTQVGNHAGKLKSIRRESKKRPRLPIFPLPEPNDFESWQKILFGKTVPFVKYDTEDEYVPNNTACEFMSKSSACTLAEDKLTDERVVNIDEIEYGIPPILRVVLRLTTHQTSGLFDLFASLIDANQALQPELGEWIFALLSAQPTPYEPSMASRMRNVCKSCRKLRALLVSDESTVAAKEAEIKSLNLLILIIAQFFDQKDLAD